ncbi:protein lin-54 homolog isoform X1 [Ischnura elegans]|uniref:protein lin-54 homolog isoform X1 n=1 Tax=Ischnura elegans TaxID=197161 RepID=UPI001ED880AC|nr:protein lin-54 homolog isoform X1 [Ischnura elegans]
MPSTETGDTLHIDCAVATVEGSETEVADSTVITQPRLSASELETLEEIRAELDCLDTGPEDMAESSQTNDAQDNKSKAETAQEVVQTGEAEDVPGRISAVVRRGTFPASTTPSVVVIQRPAGTSDRVTTTSSANVVTSAVRTVVGTTATTAKRPASGSCGPVIAKVIITGNPNTAQARPIVSMASRTENGASTQQVKILGSGQSGVTTLLASPTKAITLAQAQQMGLLSPGKVQQILPRTTMKQGVTSQMNSTQAKSPTKIAVVPATVVKSPTKILPAPSGSNSGAATTVSAPTTPRLPHPPSSPGPHRLVIRPAAPSIQANEASTGHAVSSPTGQMIRIPATQNVVTTASSNVHQIQMPGRQLQYVRLVNAGEATTRVSSSVTTVTPSSTASNLRAHPTLRMVPIAPATEESRGARRVTSVQRPQQRISSNQDSARSRSSSSPRAGQPPSRPALEPNGIRPRKPCNCTKSQCLKLYCDCFANGEFCYMCNCANCSNNLEHEEERQRAIKSCLERNPNAFRPKIGKGHVGDERRHNKGCNCKRSGCLKNYCECYEAKIPCSGMCKCVGCRNVEETPSEKKSLRDLADAAEVRVRQQAAVKSRLSAQVREVTHVGPTHGGSGGRKPRSLMTTAVIEATVQCMLAQAMDAHRRFGHASLARVEQSIVREFGKCLVRIVESAEGADSR